jgi:hypothetical protein
VIATAFGLTLSMPAMGETTAAKSGTEPINEDTPPGCAVKCGAAMSSATLVYDHISPRAVSIRLRDCAGIECVHPGEGPRINRRAVWRLPNKRAHGIARDVIAHASRYAERRASLKARGIIDSAT